MSEELQIGDLVYHKYKMIGPAGSMVMRKGFIMECKQNFYQGYSTGTQYLVEWFDDGSRWYVQHSQLQKIRE